MRYLQIPPVSIFIALLACVLVSLSYAVLINPRAADEPISLSTAGPQLDGADEALAATQGFLDALRAGDMETAKSSIADLSSEQMGMVDWLVSYLSREAHLGEAEIVSGRAFDDTAVVVVVQRKAHEKIHLQPLPIYLLRRQDAWQVLPHVNSYGAEDPRMGLGLPLATSARYDVLAQWFTGQSSILIADHLIERGAQHVEQMAEQEKTIKAFETRFGGVRWDDGWVAGLYLKNQDVTDNDLLIVKNLPRLRSLYLTGTKVTDEGLAHLVGLDNLQHLYLGGTDVSDAGLAHLAGLVHLNNLWLSGTKVTDLGIVHLRSMTEMGYLDLSSTDVTDACLEHLTGMDALYYLHLPGTGVTEDGLRHLAAQLPRLSAYNGVVTVEGDNLSKPEPPK